MVLFGADGVGSNTTTRYLWPAYQSSVGPTAVVQFRIPRAGTLQNMRVRANTTAGNGNNIVYTLRVNSVATALAVTMASTSADGSDTTDTVSVAAGDLIDVEVTKAASVGTSPTGIVCTMEYV
jgi:hypothetical protein